jgi:uncharacterized protein (DUF2342 family)
MRTALVATAVGAVAGGGVVLSFADHSAEGQASVAERTLGRPIAPVSNSVSAPQANQQTINRRESAEISWADGHVNDPATAELNASSPERQAVVAAPRTSAWVRVAPLLKLRLRRRLLSRYAQNMARKQHDIRTL